jgi:hypothetical protein
MESILTSIKKLLGVTEDYEHFDADIIMHINSVLAILTQLGVGPECGFSIKGKEEVWTDFITENSRLEFVKSYVHPPLKSSVADSMNRMIDELEWRILVETDNEIT